MLKKGGFLTNAGLGRQAQALSPIPELKMFGGLLSLGALFQSNHSDTQHSKSHSLRSVRARLVCYELHLRHDRR
jgi:hypothetical protein